jgi:hypothetical protein
VDAGGVPKGHGFVYASRARRRCAAKPDSAASGQRRGGGREWPAVDSVHARLVESRFCPKPGFVKKFRFRQASAPRGYGQICSPVIDAAKGVISEPTESFLSF